MAMETLADLEKELTAIGLSVSIGYYGAKLKWKAEIKWSDPNFSPHSVQGTGTTMLAAIKQAIANYKGE